MADVAAGAAILGAGMSIYGQLKSAQDQAAMDEFRQDLANQQADELGYRESINEMLNLEGARKAQLDFGSAYAASGKEGVGVGSQLEIMRQTQLQNALNRHDVEHQQKMLRAGGKLYGLSAQSAIQSGYWGAGGSLVGGAGQVANIYSREASSPNSSPPTKLPKPGPMGS